MARTFTIADIAAETAAGALMNAANDIAAVVARSTCGWNAQQDPFYEPLSLTEEQVSEQMAKAEALMNAAAQILGTNQRTWADTLLAKANADIAKEAKEITST